MKRLIPLCLAFSSCFVYAAVQPSFNCAKAQSAYERAVCSDSHLASLDKQMAQAYNDKRASLNSESRKELLQTQRAYLKRIQSCRDDGTCIEQELTIRIDEIQNFQSSSDSYLAQDRRAAQDSQSRNMNQDTTPYNTQRSTTQESAKILRIDPRAKPSFDCSKAQSIYERTICSDSKLAALDKQMADIYTAKKSKLNNTGKTKLTQAQRKFLQRVDECDGDTQCIEQNLMSRINDIKRLNPQDSMIENVVQMKNKYRQCLGGEDGVCHVAIIGIGDKACLSCNSGIEGSFAYIDNLKIAIYYDSEANTLVARRMEKFEAMQNLIYAESYEEGGFGSGQAGMTSSVKVLGYDDDFIHFGYEGESCGAYCTSWSGSAYFDIALRDIVGLDSEALLAKLINDEMCRKNRGAKNTQEYCQSTLAKAQSYFFSDEFRAQYGRDYVYVNAIEAWIDVRNARVVAGQNLGDVVQDSDEVRSMLTGLMEREFCNGNADSSLCFKGQEAQECYFEEGDSWGVCNLWAKGVRLSSNALLIDFSFPHALRSQDTTIKIPYNRVQPYARGVLRDIIEAAR